MRDLTKIFKALADTNRLRILKMLEVKPLCVCEMRAVLNLATSTVSKHLSILRDAALIMDEKEGKWVNYRINIDQSDQYVRHLLPLIRSWLPEDQIVLNDRKAVLAVDRHIICGG